MNLKVPEEDTEDYETFGGYVCEMLGTLPEDGTTAECENKYIKVKILVVNEHRIEKMIVEKKILDADDDEG